MRGVVGGGGGRAIVTYNAGSISLDDMIAVRDGVEAWIAGTAPVLVLPSNVRVEVYGVPKAGGSGLVYETRFGDAVTRLEAPDLPTLKTMIAELDPGDGSIQASPPGSPDQGWVTLEAEALSGLKKLLAGDVGDLGKMVMPPDEVLNQSAERYTMSARIADGIAKSLELGKAAAACACPTADLMARGCTCGAVAKPARQVPR
jgi:hypothetical protein